MKRIVTFTTQAGNTYLYNYAAGAIMPIDEATRDLIESGERLRFGGSILDPVYECQERERRRKGCDGQDLPLWPDKADDEWRPRFRTTSDREVRRNLANLRQVCFEVTTACNLRCHYCCYGDGYSTFSHRGSGRLRFWRVASVLRYVAKALERPENESADTRLSISFYGGEPLLNMDLIRRTVDYARTLNFKGRRVSFSMTTNATQLAQNMDFLARNNFILLVSLDGDREGDRHRVYPDGRESFTDVMDNLRRVRDAYPEWFKTIRFNCVYTDASDVRRIVSFFRSEFGTVPNFSPLHKADVESDAINAVIKRLDFPDDMEEDLDLLAVNPHVRMVYDFLSRGLTGYVRTEHGLLSDAKRRVYCDGEIFMNPCGTCTPFGKRMFVDHDGGIHPCEKVCRDKPLGRVTIFGVKLDCDEVARQYDVAIYARKRRYNCAECYRAGLCTRCLLAGGGGECPDFCDEARIKEYLARVVGYIESHPRIPELIDKYIAVR